MPKLHSLFKGEEEPPHLLGERKASNRSDVEEGRRERAKGGNFEAVREGERKDEAVVVVVLE